MKTKFWKGLAAACLLMAAPIVAIALSQSQSTATADESDGRIVAISPEEGDDLPSSEENPAADNERPAEAPKYWIGLQGRPIDSPALRTHLQLADDVGVLVEQIVPDSPAAKAGLRQHDVIIAVNGEPISDLRALQEVIATGADKAIDLKVIRLAKETAISVKPEERPADAAAGLPVPGGPGAGQMGNIEDLLRQFQQGNVPGGLRVFGPGMALGDGQAFDLNKMPNGISVSITRQGDGPAQITVKQGDKTWTVNSEDEEAIKKLPADVQPFVEQMLKGSRPGQQGAMRFDFGDLQRILPNDLGDLEGQIEALMPEQEEIEKQTRRVRKRTEAASRELLERIEQMEKRMHELQEQLEENSSEPRTNQEEASSEN